LDSTGKPQCQARPALWPVQSNAAKLPLQPAEIKRLFNGKNSAKQIGQLNCRISKVCRTDMKNSPLTTILVLILVVSSLASVIICWMYMNNVRQSRSFQSDAVNMQRNQALIGQLARDAVEYSKKNQAIEPILENAHVLPPKGAAGAPTNKPASK
jgi:hypothetical protein